MTSVVRSIATAGRSRAPTQLLSSRSVHLRIQPRPADLSESREIFRVLQRFGEISTYKSLRYEYHNPAGNISLAIYRDADSAQAALNASPIRFALEKVVPDDDINKTEKEWTEYDLDEESHTSHNVAPDSIDDILKPSQLTTSTPHNTPTQTPSSPHPQQPRMPFEESPVPRKVSSKWFQVTVDRSRVIHQDFVERQPFWKQFTPMKSMAQEDLAKVVPHIGLSDVSKRPPNHHRTPNKVLKTMAYYVENKMPSLRDMWEEGGMEKR